MACSTGVSATDDQLHPAQVTFAQGTEELGSEGLVLTVADPGGIAFPVGVLYAPP